MAEANVDRTYRLQPRTARRIKELAAKNEVFDSSLVDYLLTRALDLVDAGRLPIHRRAVSWVIDREDG